MSLRGQRPKKLGLIGSIIFGAVLFGAGYWLRGFIGGLADQTSEHAVMGGRAAWGLMIVGGIIVVGNLVWIGFILIVAWKKPPLN